MASITKKMLADGETRWQVRYRDAGGKQRARQFRTKKEAEAFETRTRGELATGVHTPDAASVTLAEAADLWLETCDGESLQASTLKGYREYVNLHIKPALGSIKLARLTRPHVAEFKTAMVEKRSRVTARKVVSALGAILKDAMTRGLVAQNVASEIRIKTRRAEDFDSDDDRDAIDRIPSPAEVGDLLRAAERLWPLSMVKGEDAARPTPWHPLLMVAAFTGMRISEVLGLAWTNVDLRGGNVSVRRRVNFKRELGPVKSKSGRREIPIPPMTVKLLREWKVACPKTDLDLVFPFWDGQPMHYNVARKQCLVPVQVECGWATAGAAKGNRQQQKPLPKTRYGFHDLRHFAASMFIDLGWNAKRVQAVMGHSTITMTFDLYGHLFDRKQDSSGAMAAFESSVFGK